MENYVVNIRKKIGHGTLILVGANVIIRNKKKEYLLQQRDNGNWGLLGGLMEVNESLEDTAVREVFEESGIKITDLKQIHTFSGERFRFTLDNGDQIYVVTTLFEASTFSGKLNLKSPETLDLQYFDQKKLPQNLEPEYVEYIRFYEKEHIITSQDNSENRQ